MLKYIKSIYIDYSKYVYVLIAIYLFPCEWHSLRNVNDTLEFLKHCSRDSAYIQEQVLTLFVQIQLSNNR